MHSRCFFRYCGVLAAILVGGISLATTPLFGQTITVGLNSSTLRSFPPHFYGANDQQRDSVPWDQIDPSTDQPYNPGFSGALHGLEYGISRFPGGTGSNYWDWSTGDTVTNYDPDSTTGAEKPPSPYPAPLSEFQKELNSASQRMETHTEGDFVLNMLTDPLCVPPSGQQYCSYSTSSPDESYQLQLLSTLASDKINVPYVELGNEFYSPTSVFPNDPIVYPTVQDYATIANQWIKDIKASHPAVKTAAVAYNCLACNSVQREKTWNSGLMSTLVGADAVTLHIYPTSGLPSGFTVDNGDAETMLLMPLTKWDAIIADDFSSLVNTQTGYTPDIWFTEYNLQDSNVRAAGTWAHGLYLATFSLLFATNPRVQMALHHDVQGAAEFADIFTGANAFSSYKLPIVTAVDGYSAQGLTTREIDTAALGMTQAEALNFPDAPTFDGTHPKLIGELFSHSRTGTASTRTWPSDDRFGRFFPFPPAADSQIIILNLDNVEHTVDVSRLISDGTYRQISGEAGSYVDGNTVPGGFEGYDDVTVAPANLTLATGTLGHGPLSLPAFSITRIAARNNLPFPPNPAPGW